MREIVIISGKGGTGKTTLTASFAVLSSPCVLADCDVDAADLFLVMEPQRILSERFRAGKEPVFDLVKCTNCGKCVDLCRFRALQIRNGALIFDRFSCEGCGLCSRICPAGAITMREKDCGELYVSSTPCGPMAHARLHVAEENSGKLVTAVREKARSLAGQEGLETILIDGPPGIGCPVISSVTGADFAVIVTEPTLSGLHDLKRAAELCGQFSVKTSACVNKHDLNEEMAGRIESYCRENGILFLGRIPYDRTVVEALGRGKAAVDSERSQAAAAMREIWKNISTFLETPGAGREKEPASEKHGVIE